MYIPNEAGRTAAGAPDPAMGEAYLADPSSSRSSRWRCCAVHDGHPLATRAGRRLPADRVLRCTAETFDGLVSPQDSIDMFRREVVEWTKSLRIYAGLPREIFNEFKEGPRHPRAIRVADDHVR